ncbi:hypothetical protein TRFO_29719 [Tritrichomonas foetus]|uniref:Uncharacterized protein n=1 Tax=Tritrichomonas foetus TaxID=1144522 RepID=A0A1J4JZQ2_9EUKA|nr:hypothetical protein TRFO_29719 [Tritrichomonas foetus]|eukprot:OHT03012.1 hypothetical protein TRFO_29719 [Tritrichomonas foetus]
MNYSKQRKQILNKSEYKTKRRKTVDVQQIFRHRSENDQRLNIYHASDLKFKIIQQMSDLFLPEIEFKKFVSLIPQISSNDRFSQNNCIQWNKFTGGIQKYLRSEYTEKRFSIYINEQICVCMKQINELFIKMNNNKRKVNRKVEILYEKILKDLNLLQNIKIFPNIPEKNYENENEKIFNKFKRNVQKNNITKAPQAQKSNQELNESSQNKNFDVDLDNSFNELINENYSEEDFSDNSTEDFPEHFINKHKMKDKFNNNSNNNIDDKTKNQEGSLANNVSNKEVEQFEAFSKSLGIKYVPFFQCVSNDPTMMSNLIKSVRDPIQNVIKCLKSYSQIEQIQNEFFQLLNQTSETFEKITQNSIMKQQSTLSSPGRKNGRILKRNSLNMLSKSSNIDLIKNNQNPQPKAETSFLSLLSQQDSNQNKRKKSLNNYFNSNMYSDKESQDLYPISNVKLSDSEDEVNIPPKPSKFRISQTRYEQLNKKYNAQLINRESKGSPQKIPKKPKTPKSPILNTKIYTARNPNQNRINSSPSKAMSNIRNSPKSPRKPSNITNNNTILNNNNNNNHDKLDDNNNIKNSGPRKIVHTKNTQRSLINNTRTLTDTISTTNSSNNIKTSSTSHTISNTQSISTSNTKHENLIHNDENLNELLNLNKEEANETIIHVKTKSNYMSPISTSSQLYAKRSEESKLVKKIDEISHINDKLKERLRVLQNQLSKNPHAAEINKLKKEINKLKENINSYSVNHDELMFDLENINDLIDIYTTNINFLFEECEQALRINSSIEADDETVNFDNHDLKRLIKSLQDQVSKLEAQAKDHTYQKETILNDFKNHISHLSSNVTSDLTNVLNNTFNRNSETNKNTTNNNFDYLNTNDSSNSKINEEIQLSYNQLKLYTKTILKENERIGLVYQQLCELPNPLTVKPASTYIRRKNTLDKRKIRKSVSTLENSIGQVKNSNSFSPLQQLFYSMKSNTIQMNEETNSLNFKNHQLIKKIQDFTSKSDKNLNGNVAARKNFDLYEQLRNQSRELLTKYFAIQKQKTDQLDTAAKYRIDIQLDDIQEQYTTVMMEIDRIGNTKNQEHLHEKRKNKIRGRKDGAKLLDVLSEAAKTNISCERKVVALEGSTKLSRNDEEMVAKLTEAIIECKKVDEILNVTEIHIKNIFCMNYANDELDQILGKSGNILNALTEEVKKLISKGGKKAQTQMRIYNLKKEIESYSCNQ